MLGLYGLRIACYILIAGGLSTLLKYLLLRRKNQTKHEKAVDKIPGMGSEVGNVSGNRCESDCRSRGREFDPSPILLWRLIMK